MNNRNQQGELRLRAGATSGTAQQKGDISATLRAAGIREEFEGHALLIAAKRGCSDICRQIIEAGVSPLLSNAHGYTALHYAAISNSVEVYRILRGRVPNVDPRNRSECTPLLLAAIVGCPDVSRELLRDGADVHAKDICGMQPLWYAVRAGHIEVCKTLIEHGANIQMEDHFGWSLFHHAAYSFDVNLCRLLVAAGSEPTMDGGMRRAGLSPIEMAVVMGEQSAVRYFVEECGADLAGRALNGKTLAQLANGDRSMRLLLRDLKYATVAENELPNRPSRRLAPSQGLAL